MSPVARILAALLVALAPACLELEYSPHAIVLDPSERGLHATALARLAAADPGPGAPFRFAVIGDTHLAFEDSEDAVEHLNARDDLAFVVHLGDLTHVGLVLEFRRMNAVLARLRVPYLVVVGNHDLLGTGGETYARMFGPRNLAFTHGGVRFLMFDSNSRQAGFRGDVPDVSWLAAQAAGDRAPLVLLSHVPPGTSDFDPGLLARYDALLAAGGVASFHAHEHGPRFEERRGTPVWITDCMENRSYLLATVGEGGALAVERISY